MKTLSLVRSRPSTSLLAHLFALAAVSASSDVAAAELAVPQLPAVDYAVPPPMQEQATQTVDPGVSGWYDEQALVALYWTLLGREPAADDLDRWRRRAYPVEWIAELIKRSDEYIALHGGPDRDAQTWPFASNSLWNTPIGSKAVYAPADLSPTPGAGNKYAWIPGVDREIIVLTPDAPLTTIYYNGAGWDRRKDRCVPHSDREPVFSGLGRSAVPMPPDLEVVGNTDNNPASFLASDGRTVFQTQPFTRCLPGGDATSMVEFRPYDLYDDDGIEGAHGGSGLSGLGGSLRVGELRPGQIGPQHALKLNVYVDEALFECGATFNPDEIPSPLDCYRWPARTADTGALAKYGRNTHNRNPEMKMGALLAIPSTVDIRSLRLETAPAMQLAWTLQNYGAYIVDNTAAPGYAFSVEKGPGGSFETQFRDDWKWNMAQRLNLSTAADESEKALAAAWVRDIQTLIAELHVVTNNMEASVGGGGTPRQRTAPPFRNPPVRR